MIFSAMFKRFIGIFRRSSVLFPFLMFAAAALACTGGNTNPVIYVTATVSIPGAPTGEPTLHNPFLPTSTPRGPTATAIQPTPNPTYPPTQSSIPYTVQTGDTLAAIAQNFGTDVNNVLRLNPSVSPTTILQPGQVLVMPG